MDTTLVTVTLLSMGMAGALSILVWRMLRDERQRGDARVAALATMSTRAPSGGASVDLPMRQSSTAPVAMTMGSMFEERPAESPWGQRFAVMGAIALVLASVIFFALSAAARTSTRVAAAGNTAAPAVPSRASLELISLRDTRQAGSLTITGLVRNVDAATSLQRVTVTAYTFDDKGSFLASGRALIDVTALAPGDESPFVINVPVTDTVARYRIGFRGEDGRVIAHVDKRP
jgi:hypothetical protein